MTLSPWRLDLKGCGHAHRTHVAVGAPRRAGRRRDGGARGIGGATATLLAANGARVVIAEVDAPKADETVATLNADSVMVRRPRSPPTSPAPDACDDLVHHAVDTYGRLDIVVNNAGYAWDGGIHSMSDEQFQAMLDIHLVVPFRLARATAPNLPRRSGGG